MMFHLIAAYPSIFHLGETSVPYIFQFGALGVELFFIISGFVILMTIERTPSLGDYTRKAYLFVLFIYRRILTQMIYKKR